MDVVYYKLPWLDTIHITSLAFKVNHSKAKDILELLLLRFQWTSIPSFLQPYSDILGRVDQVSTSTMVQLLMMINMTKQTANPELLKKIEELIAGLY